MIFFESIDFNSLLIGSAGSFLGALGGYLASVYLNKRKEILEDIKCFEQIIYLTNFIMNRACHDYFRNILPIRRDFCKAYLLYRKDELFEYDLRGYTKSEASIEHLETRFFDNLKLSENSYFLINMLIDKLKSLDDVIHERNNFVKDVMKSSKSKTNIDAIYFGLYDKKGRLDTTHRDSIRHMYQASQDVIWFAKKLINELILDQYQVAQNIKIFRPTLSNINLYYKEDANIFNKIRYEVFESMLKKRESENEYCCFPFNLFKW